VGNLHDDLCTFHIVSCQILHRTRNVAGKSCTAKHTNYVQYPPPPPPPKKKNHTIYEIMWKSTVQPNRSQITICCVHLACWKRKATDTHSKYVILNAFPWQQWLLELTSNIIYTLPVLLYCRRGDVQAVCSRSAHAVTKSFRIRGEWQFHMYSPLKKSGKWRQSFLHRHAQPSLTKVVWWQ